MKKTSKFTKIMFIITIICLGFFSISSVIVKSKPIQNLTEIYKCTGVIDVEYDRESLLNNPIKPLDKPREIPLRISHKVIGGYSEHIVQRYLEANDELFNRLHVRIYKAPEWCTISAVPDFFVTNLSAEKSYANIKLYLTLKETAPAFKKETIKIKIWGDPIGKGIITTPSKIFNITFMSGYKPIIKISTPKGTTKLTSPDETVYFEIDVENFGNAKTNLNIKPKNIPKGWRIEVITNLTIGSMRFGDNNKKTIKIAIHPPVSFGYHEEREVFDFSIIPAYYDNSSNTGEEQIISFVVQNEGFSTPGFEFIFLIFALFIIIVKQKNIIRKERNKK